MAMCIIDFKNMMGMMEAAVKLSRGLRSNANGIPATNFDVEAMSANMGLLW